MVEYNLQSSFRAMQKDHIGSRKFVAENEIVMSKKKKNPYFGKHDNSTL
jgi:hypothetical protein